MRRSLALIALLTLTGGTLSLTTVARAQEEPPEAPVRTGADDAVVIAVLDSGFSPYHWDFLASKMPQANDGDPTTDLPLDQAPDGWLPGFPDPSPASTAST